jgi:hypothetical protein
MTAAFKCCTWQITGYGSTSVQMHAAGCLPHKARCVLSCSVSFAAQHMQQRTCLLGYAASAVYLRCVAVEEKQPDIFHA